MRIRRFNIKTHKLDKKTHKSASFFIANRETDMYN